MKRARRKAPVLPDTDQSMIKGWIMVSEDQKNRVFEQGYIDSSVLSPPDKVSMHAYTWLQRKMQISRIPLLAYEVPLVPDSHNLKHWPKGVSGSCYQICFSVPDTGTYSLLAEAWHIATECYYVAENEADDAEFESRLMVPQLQDPFDDPDLRRVIVRSWDRILRIGDLKQYYGTDMVIAVESVPESSIDQVHRFVIPTTL